MANETNENEAPLAPDPQLLAKASKMGWAPKDQWRGDPERWIDADAFVERGEQMLPIIKAENRRLQGTAEQQATKIAAQDTAIRELTASVEALKNFNTEISKERVKTLRTQIAQEIKEAREAGDVEAELEANDRLQVANDALKASGKKPVAEPAKPPTSAAPDENPEFKAWQSENPWFGSDELRTDLSITVAERLKQKDPSISGRNLLDKVVEKVEAILGPVTNPNRQAPSKVEGGSNGAGGGGAGNGAKKTKTYADLPPDAKAACDRFEKQIGIGPNRAYKTQAEFRERYVSQYDFT